MSGNPADHFVHRHTHRVTRGLLLAVGRADGRLNSLASAESAACLSVSQASSIQNLGVTCESLTLGHNPAPLRLTQNDIFLPSLRPAFLSEARLQRHISEAAGASADQKREERPHMSLGGKSVSSLMGSMSDLRQSSSRVSSREASVHAKYA